jgi:XTP/dITP diphosphohydrolase
MKRILFGSENPDKLVEVKAILSDLACEIVSPHEVLKSKLIPEETGQTFAENAQLKATAFGRKSRLITLADDSGLVIDALGGKPGIYSARYTPDHQASIAKILKQLAEIPYQERTARFICALCIYEPKTKKTFAVSGQTEGFIVNRPIGQGGFGYDPIFFSPQLGKTFGQAPMSEKNFVSHRRRALEAAKPILKKLLKP